MEYPTFIIAIIILIELTIFLILYLKKSLINISQRRKIYVDTSALIDGRILSIAQTGFLSDDLIIPRSVVRELQLLADGKDADRRARARLGMETVNDLERVVHCNVTILQDPLDRTPVDERLLELAHKNHGLICTTDFNLAKVAETEDIEVLNVNDLAMVLRSEFLPGERLRVKVTGKGNNPGQGVGHLEDGTMVIIDNGGSKQGTDIEVEAIRFLQTERGRMLFARVARNRSRNKKKPADPPAAAPSSQPSDKKAKS